MFGNVQENLQLFWFGDQDCRACACALSINSMCNITSLPCTALTVNYTVQFNNRGEQDLIAHVPISSIKILIT